MALSLRESRKILQLEMLCSTMLYLECNTEESELKRERICIMAPAAAKGTGTAKARSAADGSGERRIQERVGGRCAQRHTASIKRQGSEISEMLLEIVK